MRTLIVVVALLAHVSLAVGQQQPDSVRRLKEGFGPPKPEPISLYSERDTLGLSSFLQLAQSRQIPDGAVDRVKAMLASTFVGGVSLADKPKDAWDARHHHFNLASAKVESAAIEPGLVLIELSGELGSVDAKLFEENGFSKIVPVLLQFSKEGNEGLAAVGVVHPANGRLPASFQVVSQRMEGANEAVLIFLNRADRSWVMYRDATLGKPGDFLFLTKIDEKTLIDLEAKRVAAVEAEKKPPREPTPEERATAATVEANARAAAEASALRQKAAEKEAAKKRALSRAQFRKWNVLGGAKASEAKIVDYDNGVVTLQKRDGKTVKIKETRLNKADREALDKIVDAPVPLKGK